MGVVDGIVFGYRRQNRLDIFSPDVSPHCHASISCALWCNERALETNVGIGRLIESARR
jgi:hypothetical protein